MSTAVLTSVVSDSRKIRSWVSVAKPAIEMALGRQCRLRSHRWPDSWAGCPAWCRCQCWPRPYAPRCTTVRPPATGARLRATKAPVGLLSAPTRNVRVAVRSLCTPEAPLNSDSVHPVLNLTVAPATAATATTPAKPATNGLDACLDKVDATPGTGNLVAN